MKMSSVVWIIVAIIVIVFGVVIWMNYNTSNYNAPTYTTSNTSQEPSTVVSTPTPTPAPAVVALDTATSTKFGTYVVDPNGMTLYTYNKDTAGVSTCTGVCAQNWPPYTVASASSISGGAKVVGTISTIIRGDTTELQITYKGLPLYYWTKDLKPGDVTGNGVGGFAVAKP